jgi:hypothetical protein
MDLDPEPKPYQKSSNNQQFDNYGIKKILYSYYSVAFSLKITVKYPNFEF